MKLYSIHRGTSGGFESAEQIGNVTTLAEAREMIRSLFRSEVKVSEMSGPHTRTCKAIAPLVGATTGWWFRADPFQIGVCTIHHKGNLPDFFVVS